LDRVFLELQAHLLTHLYEQKQQPLDSDFSWNHLVNIRRFHQSFRGSFVAIFRLFLASCTWRDSALRGLFVLRQKLFYSQKFQTLRRRWIF